MNYPWDMLYGTYFDFPDPCRQKPFQRLLELMVDKSMPFQEKSLFWNSNRSGGGVDHQWSLKEFSLLVHHP